MKQVSWIGRTPRRRLIKSSVLGLMGALLSPVPPAVVHNMAAQRHKLVPWPLINLGTTFSPLQCYYMQLDFRAAFEAIATLGLRYIRLGAYWNVIEKQRGRDDFSELDWLLDRCAQHQLDVVLAVGMKVPRWPEFHFPDWVQTLGDTGGGNLPLDQRSPQIAEAALEFTQRVIERYRNATPVKYWQIENEPFTQLEIAGGRFLSAEFVQREITLVDTRKRTDQKLLLTNALHLPTPNMTEDESAFRLSLQLADAVGMNVYTKVPVAPQNYIEPTPKFWQTLQDWQIELQQAGRETWIAEAQAEPWEFQKLVAIDKPNYPSASPLRMKTLVHLLAQIGYDHILLWGCEYWYAQKQRGQELWWWQVKQLVKETHAQTVKPPMLIDRPAELDQSFTELEVMESTDESPLDDVR